jgi:GntR family transcriptional regulator
MEQYGVAYRTAGAAIQHLVQEGLVVTRQGGGAYVRESHPVRTVGPHRYARSKWAVTTVEAHQDETHNGGAVVQQGGQIQTVRLVEADEQTAGALGVAVGELVVERDRTMDRDGKPTHTMASYYRRADVEGTAIVDPRPGIAGQGGGFAILAARGLDPHDMTEELHARMPTAEEAGRLELPPGEPVVEVRRTTRTADGYVIEYARGIHAASRFVWSYSFEIPE